MVNILLSTWAGCELFRAILCCCCFHSCCPIETTSFYLIAPRHHTPHPLLALPSQPPHSTLLHNRVGRKKRTPSNRRTNVATIQPPPSLPTSPAPPEVSLSRSPRKRTWETVFVFLAGKGNDRGRPRRRRPSGVKGSLSCFGGGGWLAQEGASESLLRWPWRRRRRWRRVRYFCQRRVLGKRKGEKGGGGSKNKAFSRYCHKVFTPLSHRFFVFSVAAYESSDVLGLGVFRGRGNVAGHAQARTHTPHVCQLTLAHHARPAA